MAYDARMRSDREARVQGQLPHPATLPIYDLAVRPDGTPFFTMKRLHRRLAAWCALLAICFVQIATAAHACTQVDPANKVRLSLTNHSAGGLTDPDFEMAKVFDGLS